MKKTVLTSFTILCLLSTVLMGLALNSQTVEGTHTATVETKLFSHQIDVPAHEWRAPNIELTEGTLVRIMFNASETVDLYCQYSYQYEQSAGHHFGIIFCEWSDSASYLNRTYTIPFTDTWYFTLVNWGDNDVKVYNITLYRLTIYKIQVKSDKGFYAPREQITLIANMTKNEEGLSEHNLTLQVINPFGNIVYNQSKQTNVYGQVTANFTLPSEEGIYNTTAKTIIDGRSIDDVSSFAIDVSPPTTVHSYDGLWHTSDLTITLTATDEVTGIAETYYRINNGSIKSVNADGQPSFHLVQTKPIKIDGNVADWNALGLGPLETDPPNNIEYYHDISSDLLEAWAYADSENLYLAVKVNGQGCYDFDQVTHQVYVSTNTELYKVKYFYWFDEEGYGYLFYWDEGSEIWQARIPNLEAQAGSEGYIEWKVPFFNRYGMPSFDYNSTEVSLRFTTFDDYYEEEVNSIHETFSLPEQFPIFVTEGSNHTLEYWSVDNAGNEELHKVLTGIKLDNTAPTIGFPSHIPESDIQPNQEVKVSVNVTDFVSTVKNVTLSYSLNDSEIWIDVPMSLNSTTGLYETIILGQEADTFVAYKIIAYDNAGNSHVEDNAGEYYTYAVIPSPDTTLPTISIQSPENKTYSADDIPLAFTVSEPASWIGYSLDGQANVTITGNTTLSGLPSGTHGLVIYANDTVGNMGASEIVYFTIETPEPEPLPEPFPTWILTIIVIIAVFGVALLVYFTKIRKTTEKT